MHQPPPYSLVSVAGHHEIQFVPEVRLPSHRLSGCLVLGPFPSQPDIGVYVRLPSDANPNQAHVDLAARGSELVSVEGDHVQLRGFEIRHGAQFQQRAQVALHGQGILLEGCHFAVRAKERDFNSANYTGKGRGAMALTRPDVFRDAEHRDYRPRPDAEICKNGTDDFTRLVTHDFYGLPRFPDEPRSVGAFRCDPNPPTPGTTVVEIELVDGTFQRR